MEIKYVYGFDPGYALSNGIKPYIIKIPFKYISEDGRCWVDPGPNIECLRYTIPAQPQWFAPGQYSFDLDEEAAAVEHAVAKVLEDGYRTVDIMSEGCIQVGTVEMGDLIAERIG